MRSREELTVDGKDDGLARCDTHHSRRDTLVERGHAFTMTQVSVQIRTNINGGAPSSRSICEETVEKRVQAVSPWRAVARWIRVLSPICVSHSIPC